MTGVIKIRLSLVVSFALTKPAVMRTNGDKWYSQSLEME